MKKNKNLLKASVFCLSLVMFTSIPATVLAETTVPSTVRTDAVSEKKDVKDAVVGDRITNVKERADIEITRRINSINELIAKINAMKRLSDSDKTSLLGLANSMISELNALKSKIDADGDTSGLKTDRQGIFNQYRIYMLFMPQLRIYAAADRINDSINLIDQVLTKLQAKVTTDTQKSFLTDAQNRLADAKKQAQGAIDAIKDLKPDGGNEGLASANKQALLSAKNMLTTALSDLQAARLDLTKVRSSLKGSVTTSSPTP